MAHRRRVRIHAETLPCLLKYMPRASKDMLQDSPERGVRRPFKWPNLLHKGLALARVRLSPQGRATQEVQMEENELYNRLAQERPTVLLSSRNWPSRQRMLPHARCGQFAR